MKNLNEYIEIGMPITLECNRSLRKGILSSCSLFGFIQVLLSGKFSKISGSMINLRFYHISSLISKRNWIKSWILECTGMYRLKVNYLFSYRLVRRVHSIGEDRKAHFASSVSKVYSPTYVLGNFESFIINMVIIGYSFDLLDIGVF